MRKKLKTSLPFLGSVAYLIIALATAPNRQQPNSQQPKAEFDQFSVTPRVCTNIGEPILRISWRVKGGGKSCLSNVRLNGSVVNGDLWSTRIQGGRCGEEEYSRETAFSLRDVFGNNIPSSIMVTADLTRAAQAGVFVGTEVMDSDSASVTAQECQGGLTPGK